MYFVSCIDVLAANDELIEVNKWFGTVLVLQSQLNIECLHMRVKQYPYIGYLWLMYLDLYMSRIMINCKSFSQAIVDDCLKFVGIIFIQIVVRIHLVAQ